MHTHSHICVCNRYVHRFKKSNGKLLAPPKSSSTKSYINMLVKQSKHQKLIYFMFLIEMHNLCIR